MGREAERGFDWVGLPVMVMLELAVECPGPDRLLCGSDYTINDPAGVILRV